MEDHFRVDPPDAPAGSAQADAELRLLAGDQVVAIAFRLPKCLRAHQHIASTGACLTDSGVPFQVAEKVVHRALGVPLATPTTDRRNIGMRLEKGACLRQPASAYLAVAIDELHELDVWRDRGQARNAGIARPRRSERQPHVQIDHHRAETSGQVSRTIGGAGVHIHRHAGLPNHRRQTHAQAFAFVAADGHHAKVRGPGLDGRLRRR